MGYISIFILVVFVVTPSQGMHSRTAKLLTAGASAAGAGYGMWRGSKACERVRAGDWPAYKYTPADMYRDVRYVCKDRPLHKLTSRLPEKYRDPVVIAAYTIAPVLLAGLATKQLCFARTSAGLLSRAKKLQAQFDPHLLQLARKASNEEAFIKETARYFRNFPTPMIQAFLRFSAYDQQSIAVASLANQALAAPEGEGVREEVQQLLSQALADQEQYMSAMQVIQEMPDYQERLRTYYAAQSAAAQEKSAEELSQIKTWTMINAASNMMRIKH